MQVEAARTGSEEDLGEAGAASVQARMATKAPAQTSLIPLPTKQVTPVAPAKKVLTHVATAHAKSS